VPSDRIHLPGCDNSHKWLCSPKGSAFLYARPEVQHLVEPLVVSWGWNGGDESAGLLALGDHTSRFIDEQEWQGTRDIAAYLSVPAAIQFQAEHDWLQVREECHKLLRYTRQAITAMTGLEPLCPDTDLTGFRNLSGLHVWYAQMATIPLPPCDAEELKRRLYDEYRVEVPVIEWGRRQFVRVSVQGYNTQDDVDCLVAALASLLPQVRQPGT
jgi:isopenicillin-N epimerase